MGEAMNLTEVLHEIVPCDMQKPYIFVSYSSNDKELVWRDVLEFQRQGYNVWLDEKNLDKTKASWKEDALLAIEDMYCMLVVFYVSKFSLVSEACYRELSKTTDELSVALHFGPVKFIAIDVDEVGNIGDFTRDLHQSIFGNPNLTKDVKSKMMLTLHQFMKDFFDSNNEKVRIHPKNEPNRKMNYYEEIMASFPDETCDLMRKEAEQKKEQEEKLSAQAEAEARMQAEAAARAEVEARMQAEIAARTQAEAEVRAWKEAVEKMQLEHAALQQEDVRRTEIFAQTRARARLISALGQVAEKKEAERKAALRQLITEPVKAAQAVGPLTREQVRVAMDLANERTSAHTKFLTVLQAGEKKLKGAIGSYAGGAAVSDVIGLMDTTLFGSAKEGFLITHKTLYGSCFRGGVIDLNQLRSIQNGKRENHYEMLYKDGNKQDLFIASVWFETIRLFLLEVLAQRGM